MLSQSKIVCGIFTFHNDDAPLRESVARLMELKEHSGRDLFIQIWDDHANPLNPFTVGWLEMNGCGYKTTDFNRNRNLNGIECVTGMLGAMREVCVQQQAVGCVKLDSDTLLETVAWVEDRHAACGFEVAPFRMAGPCYYLSLQAISGLLGLFVRRRGTFTPGGEESFPEDHTISCAAALLYGPLMWLYQWKEGKIGGFQMGVERIPDTRYRRCYALSFGDRYQIPDDSWRAIAFQSGVSEDQARREVAATVMKEYRLHNPLANRV